MFARMKKPEATNIFKSLRTTKLMARSNSESSRPWKEAKYDGRWNAFFGISNRYLKPARFSIVGTTPCEAMFFSASLL